MSSEWQDQGPWIGLGVAGNFAGHLEQAGEAGDFVNVTTPDAEAPKGLFPFYVPGSGSHFLHCDPLSSDQLSHPGGSSSIQMEPEVGLWCEIEYRERPSSESPVGARQVERLVPRFFGAHDDCSIRRPGARKISEKKNWGPHSKGFATTRFPVGAFEPGGPIDSFRLASFLEREGAWIPYGVDSALTSYSYFHERLLTWIVDRMNAQADEGPLESISDWLRVGGWPAHALVSIGATRYTPFGETHFLEPGDRAVVAVYDGRLYAPKEIGEVLAKAPDLDAIEGASVLAQTVRARAAHDREAVS